MMNEYDISLYYETAENEILKNYSRILKKYTKNKKIEDMTPEEWQQFREEALQGLKEYKKKNEEIKKEIAAVAILEVLLLKRNYQNETKKIEKEIEKLIKVGKIDEKLIKKTVLNKKKVNTILDDFEKRMDNARNFAFITSPLEDYKGVIQATETFSSGSKSLWEAVDNATMNYMKNGITTIQYANGANVNVASYAEMAIRTQDMHIRNQAGADVREMLGLPPLVIVSSHSTACKSCVPWQGHIFIDDVYSNPSKSVIKKYRKKYRFLSEAMEGGLFHPNCKHHLKTYYEGYREPDWIEEPEISEEYKETQKQRSIEREIRREKMLRDNSLTNEAKEKYNQKISNLESKLTNHINTSNEKFGREVLTRDLEREVNRFKGTSK
jgi:hypothetical protein